MSNNPDIRRLQDMVELGTPLSDKDARTLFRLYQVALASALSRRDKIMTFKQRLKTERDAGQIMRQTLLGFRLDPHFVYNKAVIALQAEGKRREACPSKRPKEEAGGY